MGRGGVSKKDGIEGKRLQYVHKIRTGGCGDEYFPGVCTKSCMHVATKIPQPSGTKGTR